MARGSIVSVLPFHPIPGYRPGDMCGIQVEELLLALDERGLNNIGRYLPELRRKIVYAT